MEKIKLSAVCNIQSGGTPARTKQEFWNHGTIPWVKIGDFSGKYLRKTDEKITESGLAGSSAKLFSKGSILFTIFATLGEVTILDIDACTNQAIAGIAIKDDRIDKDYLYYFLKSLKGYVNNIGRGVAQNNINMSILKNIEIPLQTIDEQRKTAKILDKVNSMIETRKQQLEQLDLLIKARFVEMFGNPLDGTAKYPIHQVGKIAESVDPQPSHRTPPVVENGIPYVSIKDCDYRTGTIDFAGARKVSVTVLEEHLKRYTIHNGDFVIGKIGTIGNPIFVPARNDYTLSANVVLVQPNSELVSPYFLKCSFESDFVERQFAEAKNSTSQAAFGIQKVRAIEVMNPDINVQRRFEQFANQVDKSKFMK